jgi:Lrp/AsnC family transcriptional regulator, leucine-responsive regulatory protein
MDANDTKTIAHLQEHGRESWASLAELLGITGPAVAERVRKLEERGVIRGYAAIIDPGAVGIGITAFIAVTLDRPRHRRAFLDRVASLAEVQECHHVAGDDDYLLKVRCIDAGHLDHVLSNELKGVEGIARTRTTIVLGTAKETTALPIGTAIAKHTGTAASNRRPARSAR